MTSVFQTQMLTRRIVSLVLITTSIALLSCKKNQLGGNATIKGVVKHHTKIIANVIVYIKFNSKDFPGEDLTIYDDKVQANAQGEFEIKCYKGNYYLYGNGIDSQVLVNGGKVIGGAPVKIRNKETVELTLAVTEGD